jgi:translocation and assembly module TamB
MPAFSRRALRFVVRLIVAVPVLAALLLLLVVAALETAPGQAVLKGGIVRFGGIELAGIDGSPLRRTTLTGIVLRDGAGPWLRIERLALSWSPWELAARIVAVDSLLIEGATLLRLPEGAVEEPAPQLPSAVATASQLPVSLRIDAVRVAAARVAAALLDAPADAVINGEGRLALDRTLRGSGEARIALSGIGDGHAALTFSRAETIEATLSVSEPRDGFVARLAGLPGLGALALEASARGRLEAAALDARLSLDGGVSATVAGTLDAVGAANDLHITARADAPSLALLLSGVANVAATEVTARVTGALAQPAIDATLATPSVAMSGGRVSGLRATVSVQPGDEGSVVMASATAADVTAPAPLASLGETTLAARATLASDGRATLHELRVDAAPVALRADAARSATGAITGSARAETPSLRALLPAVGVDGSVEATIVLAADGALSLDASAFGVEGPGPVATLLGERATLSATGRIAPTLRIDRLALHGQAIDVTASGELAAGEVTAEVSIALPVLAALAHHLHGDATARVAVSGAVADPSVTIELSVPRIGVAGLPDGTLSLDARIVHPLSAPEVTASGEGDLAGEPITVAVRLMPEADGRILLPRAELSWGENRISAAGTIHADGRPEGTTTLSFRQLAPFGDLLGQDWAGALQAEAMVRPDGEGIVATVEADATALALPGVRIGRASFRSQANGPLAAPVLDAALDVRGLAAGGITTNGRVTARGAFDDLALGVALDGPDHRLRSEARFALPGTLRIASLTGRWKQETVRLAAPATITLSPEPRVDRLALSLGRGGRIEVSGGAGERLDLAITARRLPLALAALAVPDLTLTGTLDVDAKVTGPPAAPDGNARLAVRGAALEGTPRVDADATVTLARGAVRANGTLRSRNQATLRFEVGAPINDPSAAAGSLAGTVSLALLDPFLAPAGREARGQLRVDLRMRERQLGGSVQVAEAGFSDAQLGLRLDGIAGRIVADGQALRIDLGARAGAGRLLLAGTVSPLDPAIPVALRLTATDASLAVGTMLSVRFGAGLAVEGAAARALAVSGRIVVERADIRLPERLPPNIVELPVQVVGTQPVPSQRATSAPLLAITLDVAVEAPRAVFVRGQGLDAEFGGNLRATGTVADPRLAGTLDLRSGTLKRLGQEFQFRRGSIVFDGAAGIEPELDFEAARQLATIAALIRVSGRPSGLSLSLASVPELPSDEVLSRILFGRSQNALTPGQLVQLASAAAELAGLTTPGGGILDRARQRLGLDRLSAGTAEGGGGEIEAGRYVADGVYLGARQKTDGTTQATIQLEVLPGVRLEADVGGESSDRVGASVGFEY